jgi:hypothetical protein
MKEIPNTFLALDGSPMSVQSLNALKNQHMINTSLISDGSPMLAQRLNAFNNRGNDSYISHFWMDLIHRFKC